MARRFGQDVDAETQQDIDVVVKEAGRMARLPHQASAPSPEVNRAAERLRKRLKGQRSQDTSVGALLDDEVLKRKIRPVAVELWATKITCINDFDREAGRDEIYVGAVAHDIYNIRNTMMNPVKLGEFGRKQRGQTTDITDIRMANIPVGPGLWRDSIYFATVYLGEKDFGGMKRYMDKSGLSSQQFLEITVGLYVASLTSLLGMSVTAEMGGGGPGLLTGFATGLGPQLLKSPGTVTRAVGAAIVEAVIGAIVHAVADDMFPPQVIPFHLIVPPGGSIDNLNAVGSIPFRFVQEKRTGNNIVRYDLHYEWRVKTAAATDAEMAIVAATEEKDQTAAIKNLDKIENIVVIMLENRSFDQMLGFLTMERGRGADFADPLKESHSNTLFPIDLEDAGIVKILDGPVDIKPHPLQDSFLEEDPGHTIQFAARQVFGDILPNDGGVVADVDPHWPEGDLYPVDPYPNDPKRKKKYLRPDKMKGFVRDAFVTLNARGKLKSRTKDAIVLQVSDVMGYHTAEHMPAYDLFATEFAVCDRWFSSFPGNTWVNRTIAMTGSPARQKFVGGDARTPGPAAGHEDHVNWIVDNQMPFDENSFFHVLDDHQYKGKPIEWSCYSQDVPSLLCIDGRYASGLRNAVQGQANRFRTIGRFFKDAAEGKLPHVSWVDPNFMDVGDMRDNLTGWNPPDERDVRFLDTEHANDDHPPIDVSHGQSFVLAIFLALMQSPQWSKTMLIVTYDEHGGFHDHVAPVPNTVPESPAFNSLGARVPAFVVSPWVDRQLVSHTQFDHTSIIKTILTKFCRDSQGLMPDVSKRVDRANHLGGLLNAKTPRFVANSTRGASMSNFGQGLATAMKLRSEHDKIRQTGVTREPTELQRQMHDGRRTVLGRIAKFAR